MKKELKERKTVEQVAEAKAAARQEYKRKKERTAEDIRKRCMQMLPTYAVGTKFVALDPGRHDVIGVCTYAYLVFLKTCAHLYFA